MSLGDPNMRRAMREDGDVGQAFIYARENLKRAARAYARSSGSLHELSQAALLFEEKERVWKRDGKGR